jgi:hypothetical protein
MNVIEFPTADRPFAEGEVDKLHAEAFRDLESGICDCITMAKIAAQIVLSTNTRVGEGPLGRGVGPALSMLSLRVKGSFPRCQIADQFFNPVNGELIAYTF